MWPRCLWTPLSASAEGKPYGIGQGAETADAADKHRKSDDPSKKSMFAILSKSALK